MKRVFHKVLFPVLFTVLICLTAGNHAIGQVPSPPPPPNGGPDNGHGMGSNQGPSAPLAGGIGILLTLGVLYSGRKIYQFRSVERKILN